MISVRKSPNMMSTTGRIPVIAAPSARPVMPGSEMGVSSTRSGPNSCTSPLSTLNGWPASATSSPSTNTVGSRRSSSTSASFTAWPNDSWRVPTASSVGEDILGHLARVGEGRVQGVGHGVRDLGLDLLPHAVDRGVVAEPRGEQLDRVAVRDPQLLLLLLAVVGAVDVADVVAVVAVGRGQEERRAVAAARPLYRTRGRPVHRDHVLPVDLLRGDAERL